MYNEKCFICGSETYTIHVECANGYIRNICEMCYKQKMASLDPLTILQAKVEGIAESLSEVQKQQVENIANNILERQAFKDVK